MFIRFCVQPRHWELEHSAVTLCYVSSASAFNQDIGSWNTEKVTRYGNIMFYFCFCVQPRHFLVDRIRSDDGANDDVSPRTAFQAKFTCTDAVTGPASSSCTNASRANWHAFVAVVFHAPWMMSLRATNPARHRRVPSWDGV